MSLAEILIIIGCGLVVLGVIVTAIIRKKKGITSCDCGCDCAHCKACNRIKTK